MSSNKSGRSASSGTVGSKDKENKSPRRSDPSGMATTHERDNSSSHITPTQVSTRTTQPRRHARQRVALVVVNRRNPQQRRVEIAWRQRRKKSGKTERDKKRIAIGLTAQRSPHQRHSAHKDAQPVSHRLVCRRRKRSERRWVTRCKARQTSCRRASASTTGGGFGFDQGAPNRQRVGCPQCHLPPPVLSASLRRPSKEKLNKDSGRIGRQQQRYLW